MKRPVSIFILHNLLGGLLSLSDDQIQYLMSIDSNDPTVLRTLIQRWVVPNFSEYDGESQRQILSSLEFFLATPDNIIERVLPSCQVPIEPSSGRYFFTLIWKELVGKEFDPSSVNCSDYDVAPGVTLANSLKKRRASK